MGLRSADPVCNCLIIDDGGIVRECNNPVSPGKAYCDKHSYSTIYRILYKDGVSELITDGGSKKCTCPRENFYFNGVGCRCGGL